MFAYYAENSLFRGVHQTESRPVSVPSSSCVFVMPADRCDFLEVEGLAKAEGRSGVNKSTTSRGHWLEISPKLPCGSRYQAG